MSSYFVYVVPERQVLDCAPGQFKLRLIVRFNNHSKMKVREIKVTSDWLYLFIYYNLMASEIVHTKRIVKIAIWIIRKGVQDPITNRSPMILYYYNLQD